MIRFGQFQKRLREYSPSLYAKLAKPSRVRNAFYLLVRQHLSSDDAFNQRYILYKTAVVVVARDVRRRQWGNAESRDRMQRGKTTHAQDRLNQLRKDFGKLETKFLSKKESAAQALVEMWADRHKRESTFHPPYSYKYLLKRKGWWPARVRSDKSAVRHADHHSWSATATSPAVRPVRS